MRRAAKRDVSEAPIVQALRAHGVRVAILSDPGVADLLCWDSQCQGCYLIEIKATHGRLTRLQGECMMPFVVCHTVDEALADLRARRAIARLHVRDTLQRLDLLVERWKYRRDKRDMHYEGTDALETCLAELEAVLDAVPREERTP